MIDCGETMANTSTCTEELVLKLHEVGAIKFGTFKLKSGIESPVYFDLRVMVSYPGIMADVSEVMWETLEKSKCVFDSVCGVPYTALPIATCISVKHNKPMLIRRKEAKDYGTRKMIEGHYKEGEMCLVVEDVVTSGSSVLETVQALNNESIMVKDAVVLLDRDQGGKTALQRKGITLHGVLTLTEVLKILQAKGKLNAEIVQRTEQFIQENRFDGDKSKNVSYSNKEKMLTHKQKASMCTHPLSRRLYTIMDTKETNIALSVDLTNSKDILQLVDRIGSYICIVKTHVDIIEDFTDDFIEQLEALATKHNFLIFEDRKFADIGNTVKQQYKGGMYRISNWAHIVNAHAVPGSGIIKGLKEVGLPLQRGCLLLAEMSSEGTLAQGDYTKVRTQADFLDDVSPERYATNTEHSIPLSHIILTLSTPVLPLSIIIAERQAEEVVKMAEENKDFVMGYICQSKLSSDPNMVHMIPGVRIGEIGDTLGQQYVSPQQAVCQKGADVIIVGRGIILAGNPESAAEEYRLAGYSAYRTALCS